MEAEITSANVNPLLDRTELEVDLNHEGEATPSKEAVIDRIAAEKDLEKDEIEVDGIYTGFGRNTSRAEIKVNEELELEEVEKEETETEETGSEEDGADNEDADYEEIVSGTISDAKDELEELDNPDYEAALEAEKDNKNRTTFIDWLESQAE